MRIEKLSAVLLAVIALMFSYSAFAEEETKHPCKEPVDAECEVVPVTGENPNDNDDDEPYEFCMALWNDHGYCTGVVNPSPDTPTPTNFEQEAPTINYEESYQEAASAPCSHFAEAARNAPAQTAGSAWDIYNACMALEALCVAWEQAEGTNGEALFRAGGASSAAFLCSLAGPLGVGICGALGREYTDEAMDANCSMSR